MKVLCNSQVRRNIYRQSVACCIFIEEERGDFANLPSVKEFFAIIVKSLGEEGARSKGGSSIATFDTDLSKIAYTGKLAVRYLTVKRV